MLQKEVTVIRYTGISNWTRIYLTRLSPYIPSGLKVWSRQSSVIWPKEARQLAPRLRLWAVAHRRRCSTRGRRLKPRSTIHRYKSRWIAIKNVSTPLYSLYSYYYQCTCVWYSYYCYSACSRSLLFYPVAQCRYSEMNFPSTDGCYWPLSIIIEPKQKYINFQFGLFIKIIFPMALVFFPLVSW